MRVLIYSSVYIRGIVLLLGVPIYNLKCCFTLVLSINDMTIICHIPGILISIIIPQLRHSLRRVYNNIPPVRTLFKICDHFSNPRAESPTNFEIAGLIVNLAL